MFEQVAAASKKKLGKQLDIIFESYLPVYASFLNTRERKAMFVAHLAHETGRFKYTHELGDVKYLQYLEGKKDLGNTEQGDGVKYKGRGLIMLTGKYNYTHYSDVIGIDLVNYPEMAEEPEFAMRIAMEYWRENEIFKCEGDVKKATRRVNGGYNGLRDRKMLFEELMK